MTTQIPPVPSGYVRQRRPSDSFADSLGPLRPLAVAVVRGLHRLAGLAKRLSHAAAQRRQRAIMVGELASLSDHTLRDIGIDRSAIRSAVLDIEKGVDPRAR